MEGEDVCATICAVWVYLAVAAGVFMGLSFALFEDGIPPVEFNIAFAVVTFFGLVYCVRSMRETEPEGQPSQATVSADERAPVPSPVAHNDQIVGEDWKKNLRANRVLVWFGIPQTEPIPINSEEILAALRRTELNQILDTKVQLTIFKGQNPKVLRAIKEGDDETIGLFAAGLMLELGPLTNVTFLNAVHSLAADMPMVFVFLYDETIMLERLRHESGEIILPVEHSVMLPLPKTETDVHSKRDGGPYRASRVVMWFGVEKFDALPLHLKQAVDRMKRTIHWLPFSNVHALFKEGRRLHYLYSSWPVANRVALAIMAHDTDYLSDFAQANIQKVETQYDLSGNVVVQTIRFYVVDGVPVMLALLLETADETPESEAEQVTFVRKYTKEPYTYEVYSGPSKLAAQDFLHNKTVSARHYYVIVETPDGNWGKDVQGLFLEHLEPWQEDLDKAECEGRIKPDSFVRYRYSAEMAAKGIQDNSLVDIVCGKCGKTWTDGVRIVGSKKTVVKCPYCGAHNLIDTSRHKIMFVG
ncbi:MAG: hypothetical protein ACTSYX_03000 [Candidatus Thorarchaeota archaeon]